MFGKEITNVDLEVCCSVDVQLHILDSSCILKKKSLGKLFGQSVAAVFGSVRKMHLPKLSESFVDDPVGHCPVAERKTDGKGC